MLQDAQALLCQNRQKIADHHRLMVDPSSPIDGESDGVIHVGDVSHQHYHSGQKPEAAGLSPWMLAMTAALAGGGLATVVPWLASAWLTQPTQTEPAGPSQQGPDQDTRYQLRILPNDTDEQSSLNLSKSPAPTAENPQLTFG